MAVSSQPPRSRLGRYEAFWGYLFIAAPLLGFIIFAAGPLVASLVLSFTDYDILTPPRWVGTQNWQEILGLTVVTLPQQVDDESGEFLFRCGRETVLQSEIADYEGRVDERTRQVMTCAPLLVRATDVLPDGYAPWFDVELSGTRYLVGARDAILWEGLFNTVFLLLAIPISLALALILALALNQQIAGKNLFRVVYYLPTILPLAAIALVWLWIYNPDFGLLNYLLREAGFTSLGRTNWLQDREAVKPALILMGVWSGLGYQMLIYLAGIQGVPRQLYEAAEIDGAGWWAKFWNVTWPALTPTTFFLLITSMIAGFQNFLQPYIMTSGGPGNASRTVVMTIYDNAFRDLQMGYASAQAWMLGTIIIAITVVNFLLARRWVFYEGEGLS